MWLSQSQTYSSVYAWYFLSDTKKGRGQEIMSFKTTQITEAVASGAGATRSHMKKPQISAGLPWGQTKPNSSKKKKKEFFHVGLEN